MMLLLRIQLILLFYCFNGTQANSHKNDLLHQPQKILSIDVNCTRDLMHLKLNMGKPFKGVIFAKSFMDECGSSPGSSSLTLPLTSCGIRSKMLSKDIMQYSVRLVAQKSSKLQLKSDIEITAKCEIPSTMMDTILDNNEMMKLTTRNGRMRYLKNSMKIRSWLEIGTQRQEYAIVGENATFSAIALVPRNMGMRIVDCIAFDGIGDSSQKLFDEFGCPIDVSLMAEFKEKITNIEDGWSKPNEDDVVQKIYSTAFQAFKFPDKDTVHFSCGILLCKGPCPKECDGHQELYKPITRLEIFNSLKVIAPQIEAIDRPQKDDVDGEKNSSDDAEKSDKFIGPDVLCVSQSRLAMAFCILGIIFLLAVIVAIYCSIKYLTHRKIYHRQSPSDSNSGRRSIFSMSSSSNNFSQSSLGDIDSKLFAYGRVY